MPVGLSVVQQALQDFKADKSRFERFLPPGVVDDAKLKDWLSVPSFEFGNTSGSLRFNQCQVWLAATGQQVDRS